VKNNKGEPRRIGGDRIGVVLATVIVRPGQADATPQIVFGWSKTNLKGGDTFDKQTAINIASTRALNGPPKGKKYQVPAEVEKIKAWFAQRALNYFKGATL